MENYILQEEKVRTEAAAAAAAAAAEAAADGRKIRAGTKETAGKFGQVH